MGVVRHIDQLNDGIEFKKIQLKDNSLKLQLLNSQYEELNKELQKKDSDKSKIEQQLKDLQKERDSLSEQLQAKIKQKERDIAIKAQEAVTSSVNTPKAYAMDNLTNDPNVAWIIAKESGGNPYAINKSSGACGLFQKLPCNVPLGDVEAQMTDGLTYIKNRYGTSANAVAFWKAHGWY